MTNKTYFNYRRRIRKTITGVTGILFLFYVISCGSTPSPTTQDATPPSAVENLKVESLTDSEVVLSWVAPANRGTIDGKTATVIGYVVKYREMGNAEFVKIDETSERVQLAGSLTGDSTHATVTNLDGNTAYTFLVVAVNSGGAVGLDTKDSQVEVTTAPLPSKNLRESTTCDKTVSVDLAWDTSLGATSYQLYRDDVPIRSTPDTAYTDTGLTPGMPYTYTVRACKDTACSGDSAPLKITTSNNKNFKSIIDYRRIPADLTGYDQRSREIFSVYNRDTPLVVKYLKPGDSGDGSSFANAAGDPKAIIDGITDAAAEKVYVVLLAGGTYTPETMTMKNHVVIVGGVDECLNPSDTVTALDGEGKRQVYDNESGLNDTALLYGVTITNGNANLGGGMYNSYSSPSLIGVTFSGNTANNSGGGMYNSYSLPSLIGVTFSGNTANNSGGGMYNSYSSPNLIGVTFFRNTAAFHGGGMYNDNDNRKGPTIINSIFWSNTAHIGAEFYIDNVGSRQENLQIYNSIVAGGTGNLISGTPDTGNIDGGGFVSSGGIALVVISFFDIIATDPKLVVFNNRGAVLTHAIPSDSPAVNQGLYVRRKDSTYYYSVDNNDWYKNPDLSGTPEKSLNDAEDLTATDATGRTRRGRPDLGAYEAR